MSKPFAYPSLAARLFHLDVQEELLLLVAKNMQHTLSHVHVVASTTEALVERQFSCQKWLLVRDGEIPRHAVLVTRTA